MELVQLLESYEIPAGEAYPGMDLGVLREPRALVSAGQADMGNGSAELSVRVLSPRKLGLWKCQELAAKVMLVLANLGMTCRMDPMTFQEGCDCFCVNVRTMIYGFLEESHLKVLVDGVEISCVTEFCAEQDRGRRFIGGVNQETPVGVTSGVGGWKFRLVRFEPTFGGLEQEPEEPFAMTVTERGYESRFSGCVLNRVKKSVTREGTRVEWEGLALIREEV